MTTLALAASFTAVAADAQTRIDPDELQVATPALAERLLGRPMPGIVEAKAVWLRGVAQWSGISVYFAPHPDPVGRSGLCRVEMYVAQLRFEEPRTEESGVVVERTSHYHNYALASPEPSFAPVEPSADASACRALTPLLVGDDWPMAFVEIGGREAEPEEIVFAYRAIRAARRARNVRGFICPEPNQAHCRDVAPYLRSLDLRQLQHLRIGACIGSTRLCVTGWLPGRSGYFSNRIVVETDGEAVTPWSRPVRVRSVDLYSQVHAVT